jgi:hypothetical protein
MSPSSVPDGRGGRIALAAAVLALLVLVPAATALADRGAFVTSCDYSHSSHDDPIMFPGQPGASHLHDFFGSERANASSTLRSLRRGATTCLLQSDTAAYWMPTLYLDGTRIRPDRVRAYYFGNAHGFVQTIPPGLQTIAGNPAAITTDENPHVNWFCGAAQLLHVATPLTSQPYNCRPYARDNDFVDGIVAKIDFPRCWNGLGTAPSDLTYGETGCPDDFPYVLPRLILRVHYGIMDPCAGVRPCGWDTSSPETIAVTLASGSFATYHADFWNAWHRRPLARLVRVCLNEHIDCGGQRS